MWQGTSAPSIFSNSMHYYDLLNEKWDSSGTTPEQVVSMGYGLINQKIYLAGGQKASGGTNKVYAADLLPHRDLFFRSVASETINREPTSIFALGDLNISENQPIGTIVGEFNATDPDGDEITYSLVSGAGDTDNRSLPWMQMDSCPLPPSFDYESSAQSFTIRVQAKDDSNDTFQKEFTISLTDEYEDTDGDGFRDSLEYSAGSSLNDPASTPFNYGLVAWYPFDGNASDMSGNGNHGTVNGATLGTDRHGVDGKAFSFDGVDDWIDLNTVSFDGALDRNQDYSVNFWVKLTNSNNMVGFSAIIQAGRAA